jgi:hypothetical protein
MDGYPNPREVNQKELPNPFDFFKPILKPVERLPFSG